MMCFWDDVDANEDDATEEEELARPNSPSFNARTRFDDVARRIISYLFSLSSFSLRCARVRGVYTRRGNGIKVTSPSIRLKLGLKVYQKRSKKEYFFVRREAKTKKSSSEERATSPLLVEVRGQFCLFFAREISSFVFLFEMKSFCLFFTRFSLLFFLSRGFSLFGAMELMRCNRFLLTNEINMLYFYTHTNRY